MKSIAALLVALLIAAPTATAIAGNARSDRTAYHFQQDRYRAAVSNSQWAAHFRAGRQDTLNSYSPDVTTRINHSRLGAIQYRYQEQRRQFFGQGPYVPIRRR